MSNHHHHQPPGEPDPPASLRRALDDLHPPMSPPDGFDEATLESARRALEQRGRGRLLRRIGGAAAAAAGLALVASIWLVFLGGPGGSGAPPRATLIAEDIDASGRVDVRDALIAARTLASDAQPPDAWDFTRDGVVNQRDVDHIAARAVRLEKGATP